MDKKTQYHSVGKRATTHPQSTNVSDPRAARTRMAAKLTRLSRLGLPVPLVGSIVEAGQVVVADRTFTVGCDALGQWVLTSSRDVQYVLRRTHRAAGELLAVTALAPSRSLPVAFSVIYGPLGAQVQVLS